MERVIAIRARKETIAVFNRYAAIAGKQDRGRPQAIVDFVTYLANLTDEEAEKQLKAAAVTKIDITGIDNIPSQLRIAIDIEDGVWTTAIERFRRVFGLKTQPQMPYFIRVAGLACIAYTEQHNATKIGIPPSIADIECFKNLSLDEKLIEIYKLLLKWKEVV